MKNILLKLDDVDQFEWHMYLRLNYEFLPKPYPF